MPPKTAVKAKEKGVTTPPEKEGTIYDLLVVINLKQDDPVSTIPAEQLFNGDSIKSIMQFDPTSQLSDAKRMRIGKFVLDKCDGPLELSVFCRVQAGTDERRITDLVEMLNKRFRNLNVQQRSLMKVTLIKNFSEKLMKDWDYPERNPITGIMTFHSWKGVATRKTAVQQLPQTTGNEDDSDSDPDFVRTSKKGARKSSSATSSLAPTPTKNPPADLLKNPFFTPSSQSSTKTVGTPASGTQSTGITPKKGKTPLKAATKGVKYPPIVSIVKGKEAASSPKASAEKPPPGRKIAEAIRRSQSSAPMTRGAAKKTAAKEAPSKAIRKRKLLASSDSSSDSVTITEEVGASPAKRPTLEPIEVQRPRQEEEMEQDLPSQPAGSGTHAEYYVPIQGDPNDDMVTCTTATIFTDEMMDVRMTKFLADHMNAQANSDVMKAAMREMFKEVLHEEIVPFFQLLQENLREHVTAEVRRAHDATAKRAALTKLMEDMAIIKQAISDFSIESANIRVEMSKMRESEADIISRSNGILSRLIPFEIMGPACDIFFASHYVQDNIVHFMKDGLTGIRSKVNKKIAFAFTNAFFTKMGMAHLIWKQPRSLDRVQYFKRTAPESIERVIKNHIIPYVRKELELRGETYLENYQVIRKKISQRYTNCRTKQIEWAFEKTWTAKEGIDALFAVDNEFYINNTHAIPPIEPDQRDAYEERLMKRAEAKKALKANDEESKWEDGRVFETPDKVFNGFSGAAHTRKVWSKYEAIKCIVASAAARKMDITKLTWDPIDSVPDVKEIYKKVQADYINSLDELLREYPHDPNFMERIKSSPDESDEDDDERPAKGKKKDSSETSVEDDSEGLEEEVEEEEIEEIKEEEEDEDSDEVQEVIESPPELEDNSDSKRASNESPTPPAHDPTEELLGIPTGSSVHPSEIAHQLAIERSIKELAEKRIAKKK